MMLRRDTRPRAEEGGRWVSSMAASTSSSRLMQAVHSPVHLVALGEKELGKVRSADRRVRRDKVGQ